MKKLLALAFLTIAYIQSFAQDMATTIISSDTPPPTPDGFIVITPRTTEPGVPDDSTPIDFIIPFLIITVVLFTIYTIKKNKAKAI